MGAASGRSRCSAECRGPSVGHSAGINDANLGISAVVTVSREGLDEVGRGMLRAFE